MNFTHHIHEIEYHSLRKMNLKLSVSVMAIVMIVNVAVSDFSTCPGTCKLNIVY